MLERRGASRGACSLAAAAYTITFCDRLHRRTVTDTAEDEDGIDGSADYQRTKSANAAVIGENGTSQSGK